MTESVLSLLNVVRTIKSLHCNNIEGSPTAAWLLALLSLYLIKKSLYYDKLHLKMWKPKSGEFLASIRFEILSIIEGHLLAATSAPAPMSGSFFFHCGLATFRCDVIVPIALMKAPSRKAFQWACYLCATFDQGDLCSRPSTWLCIAPQTKFFASHVPASVVWILLL